jgi:hypothetical protein
VQLRNSAFPYLTLATAFVLVAPSLSAAQQRAVKLEKQGDTINVTIDGQPFTVYNTSKDLPKPFLSPVRSEGGTIISRPLEKPEDHPHHKGIWLSIDEVNDIGFWAEKGKIQNVSAEPVVAEGYPAKLKVVNHWLGNDGKPVLVETTTISIYPHRLMTYDIRLTAASGPVTFGDTKEGLFGIRVNNTMREGKGGKGTIVNAEGLKGSRECWGKTSKWVDYYGPTEGEIHGVAIFDHPENFRKSRYHVRDYGLFTISPFGEKSYTGSKEPEELYELKQGQSLRLRYAIYIHPGDTESARVGQVYEQFVKST